MNRALTDKEASFLAHLEAKHPGVQDPDDCSCAGWIDIRISVTAGLRQTQSLVDSLEKIRAIVGPDTKFYFRPDALHGLPAIEMGYVSLGREDHGCVKGLQMQYLVSALLAQAEASHARRLTA